MRLELLGSKPFAIGGNRLCFIHPGRSDRCVKVRRPDFTLTDLRRKKGFPKNLRPLSSIDDNAEEYRVMMSLDRKFGRSVYKHVSECFGFEDTDLGKGLVSELICDPDGRISFSLKQYLWEHGRDESVDLALAQFCDFWQEHAIPSRTLLLHNLVAQRNENGGVARLVVIDGLGSPNLIPFHWLSNSVQSKKVGRKLEDLHTRFESYVKSCESGTVPSSVGRLIHDGTPFNKDNTKSNNNNSDS
jgi:hypothetical protein